MLKPNVKWIKRLSSRSCPYASIPSVVEAASGAFEVLEWKSLRGKFKKKLIRTENCDFECKVVFARLVQYRAPLYARFWFVDCIRN